jgi:hypothetical protein
MAIRELTAEEISALVAYAKVHGAHWKSALQTAWMNASEPGILQQLRNDAGFGPRGLLAFRVTKAMAASEVVR